MYSVRKGKRKAVLPREELEGQQKALGEGKACAGSELAASVAYVGLMNVLH